MQSCDIIYSEYSCRVGGLLGQIICTLTKLEAGDLNAISSVKPLVERSVPGSKCH